MTATVIDPIMQTLVERRGHLRISQRALARRVGTSQSAICDWETGGGINLSSLRKLCAALDYELGLQSVRDPLIVQGWKQAT